MKETCNVIRRFFVLTLAFVVALPGIVFGVESFGETVGLGGTFSVVIDEHGGLWAWGDNQFGQIGDGTNVVRSSPVQVMENVVHVAVGANHTLAITAEGHLYAWGDAREGQLGTGQTLNPGLRPVRVMSNVAYAGAHGDFSYAILNDGSLFYWGRNIFQSPWGTYSFAPNQPNQLLLPVQIMAQVSYVTTNGAIMAVIRNDGSLWTWGSNERGMVGDGFVSAEAWTETARIRVYHDLGPALDDDDDDDEDDDDDDDDDEEDDDPNGVQTPNYEYQYQVIEHPAVNNDRPMPVRVMENVAKVALGERHVVVLNRNNQIFAWGANNLGQIGDGSTDDRALPVAVGTGLRTIAVGDNHNLALGFNNALFVWGDNSRGQLGAPLGSYVTLITANNHINEINHIWAVRNQSAAISRESLFIWGANDTASIGDGSFQDRHLPASVLLGAAYAWIRGTHTFAADINGALWAWGANTSGQIGDGTFNPRTSPYRVLDSIALPGAEAEQEEEPAPVPDPVEVGDVTHPHFFPINYAYLNDVTDGLTALEAVRSAVVPMTVQQRAHRDNADAMVRFAEHAVMRAMSVSLDFNRVTLNSDFGATYASSLNNLAGLAQNTLTDNGLQIDRAVASILNVVLPSDGGADIIVDQSFANANIDRVVFSVGQIDIIVDTRQIHDNFIIIVPPEAVAAAAGNLGRASDHAGVRIDISGQIANHSKVFIGIPAVSGVADRNQTVFSAAGDNLGGMVNPNTNRIETVISGSTTLTATEVNLPAFADIFMLDSATQSAIMFLRNKGRIGGRSDTIFDPLAPVTRAEFGTMLLFALSEVDPNAPGGGFADVFPGDWFYAIAGMNRARGYISGFAEPDGTLTFQPNVVIPKVQLIAIAGRVLLANANYFDVEDAYLAKYLDFAEIPEWARAHVAVMSRAGLFTDSPPNLFQPNYEMNRGQAAAIIANLYRRLY